MEYLDGIHLLAAGDELQRFVHHRTNRDRRTAARIAVEFGKHHAVEIQPLVELAGRIHGILTRHRIDHEERFARFHGLFDRRDLLHHRLIDGQTARRIDDHDVETVLTGVFDGIFGDLHRIFIPLFSIDFDSDLSAQHLELVDGRRTIDVARHEQHLASLLALEHRRQLAREGSLTGALQTGDQDDRRRALQLDVGRRAAHELCQLVADDLGNHLSRLDGLEHVLSQGLLLHLVGEGFGYLVIDVGVDQRPADLLEGFGDVDFGDAAFALDQLEGPFEFIG